MRTKTPRRGRPKGTKNGYYTKKSRRQGDIAKQRILHVRFASEEERLFVEEAARSNYPDVTRPIPRFMASAALDKAERILQRPRPSIHPALAAIPA